MAESRLMLEQRIMNEELGALEVGDCNCKTRLVERIGSGSFGDVYLGLTQDNTKVTTLSFRIECCCVVNLSSVSFCPLIFLLNFV